MVGTSGRQILSSLKQRFAIQGGSASFDLPQLQYWLNRSEQTINNDMNNWIEYLDQIKLAMTLVLKFIRQRNEFETINTDTGFYQDSGEGILLLRIQVPENSNFYPSVSGNRFRYSIRFMLPCEDAGRKYANQPIQFQLARC